MLAVGAGFSAGCEPLLDDGSLGSTSANAPANAPSPETKQLARSIEPFLSVSTPGAAGYQIGAQDVLDIVVFKVPELTRTVQVADAGTVNLPLVGEAPVAGKTSQQIERDLAARLGAKYLRSPQVSVYVKEFNSQRVTIEGAVKKPGLYPIRGKGSLLQFIAMAEGLDREVASNTVMVFRTSDDQRIAAEFNLDDIRAGQAQDPAMRNGDVIIVPTSASKVVLSNFLKIAPALAAFRPTVF